MNDAVRVALTGSLLYAAYTAWTCPCERACECKLTSFMLSAGLPLVYVVMVNSASK
jgi:hypothetical protein